jgi:hypothetical protein
MQSTTPSDQSYEEEIHAVPIIETSPRSNLSQIILLIIGAVILSGVSYYIGTLKKQPVAVSEPQESPLSVQQETVTAPDTDLNEWETYTVKELHLSLKLPKSFKKYGEFKETTFGNDAGGTQVCATFTKQTSSVIKQVFAGISSCVTNKFGIGTTSVEFSAPRESGFADGQGFKIQNGKFYAKTPVNKEWEIPQELVTKVENSNGLEIIKVTGAKEYSAAMQMHVEVIGTPGKGKVGALVNTQDINYPGFTMEMELDDQLTEEVFDEILKSLHVVK